MMLNPRAGFLIKRVNLKNYNPVTLFALYSRKSNSNQDDSFKIVGRKGAETKDEVANTSLGVNPNWELLTPQGFRFYLPGNTGPAWQDVHSSANVASHAHVVENSSLVCTVQECPILLRPGVFELFSGADVYGQLTVVTLAQTKFAAGDLEAEQLTKQFVLAAQDICSKLKMAGYWADFINPFSGLPYLTPSGSSSKLFETDERFRCLGFRIFQRNQCKVIDKSNRQFVGNLFTSAPPSTTLLRDILQQYED
ncbi:cobalamin trafficking protein CblD-like isoform X2 [Macrosteles quadrilineatus]|uniref:cobalamin trafficking protein CblD-like isoform X2 n=1 Tax=Macrosteles quadrilineatus TaxID=74068 RepID=UPI0023E0DAA1|nr:cobalamin trafficking protein CblD-like isoform X2 [Macrosteles quadrilineatus]